MPGRVVIQWDKDNVEDAGLIKIDLLSLRTLSAMDECLRPDPARHDGRDIDLDALPLDDPAVYDALQRADTVGAFQVESRAQQQALVQMQPRRVRRHRGRGGADPPGAAAGRTWCTPSSGGGRGWSRCTYLHPLLEPILAETLGVVVFQEQVIRVAMAMGRFSAGRGGPAAPGHVAPPRRGGDGRAFASALWQGAVAQGVAASPPTRCSTKLAGFASYGFCKIHAAAFAKTAYDTLWLRAHYPAAYYCGVLNNEPMGFYAPRVVVGDARRHGVRDTAGARQPQHDGCTLSSAGGVAERAQIRAGLSVCGWPGRDGRRAAGGRAARARAMRPGAISAGARGCRAGWWRT